jgi:hypothetical protein
MKVGVHELRQGPAWVSLSQNVLSGADLDGSALPTVTTSKCDASDGVDAGRFQQDYQQHLHEIRASGISAG